MMALYTHAMMKDLAVEIRRKDKTPDQEDKVSDTLRSLTRVQKIWLSDELSLLDSKK